METGVESMLEESLAERRIELDAMADEQIDSVYNRQFREPADFSAGREAVIDRMLAKIQEEAERG